MRIATIVLSAFLALYVAVLGCSIGAKNGYLYDEKGQLALTDYISLWGAGRLATEGQAAAAYDWDKHDAAQAKGLGRPLPNLSPVAYPPTFLLVVAPFASLPYLPSLLLWTLSTLAAYAAVNGWIIGRPAGAIWMSATTATVICFWLGQNGLLSAALLGAGLLLAPTRPLLAGVALGLLSYKPHMGLLIPFALAAAGMWRTLLSAAVTAVLFALASLAVFGVDAWTAAFDGMARFSQFMLHTYPTPERLQTLFGALRTLGAPVGLALSLQSVLAVAAIMLVAVVWRSAAPYRLKAALLAACLVLPTPYLFVYDMTLLTIAQAFLIAHILPQEPDRPDIYGIAAANVAVTLAISGTFPMAVLAAPALLVAILWRLWPVLAGQRADVSGSARSATA